MVREALSEAFFEQGYALIPAVLRNDEVATLRCEARRILVDNAALLGLPASHADEIEASVLCLHQPHKLSALIVETAKDCRIVSRLRTLIGDRIKLVQSQLFFKGPEKPGNGWHQDEAAIPTRDRSLIGAWLALDEASTTSGCLKVAPGSHHDGYLYPHREHRRPDRWDFPSVAYGFDEARVIDLEASPGDLILLHGYLVHGSDPNRSDSFRRALTFHYMNAFSLLPWKHTAALAGERVRPATLDYRDIVMVAGEDPYHWKGHTDESRPHLREWGMRRG